jgi:hypothetical protein
MSFRAARTSAGRLAPFLAALIVSADWRAHGAHSYLRVSVFVAKRPRRLARPRTPAFHVGNTGSNPVGDAPLFWTQERLGAKWVPNSFDARADAPRLVPTITSRDAPD